MKTWRFNYQSEVIAAKIIWSTTQTAPLCARCNKPISVDERWVVVDGAYHWHLACATEAFAEKAGLRRIDAPISTSAVASLLQPQPSD